MSNYIEDFSACGYGYGCSSSTSSAPTPPSKHLNRLANTTFQQSQQSAQQSRLSIRERQQVSTKNTQVKQLQKDFSRKQQRLRCVKKEHRELKTNIEAMERYRAFLLGKLQEQSFSSSSSSRTTRATRLNNANEEDAFTAEERQQILSNRLEWIVNNGRLKIRLERKKDEVVPKFSWKETAAFIKTIDQSKLKAIIISFGQELTDSYPTRLATSRAITSAINGLKSFRRSQTTLSIIHRGKEKTLFRDEFWQRMHNLVDAFRGNRVWGGLRGLELRGFQLNKLQAGRLVSGFYHAERSFRSEAAPTLLERLPAFIFRGKADQDGSREILLSLLPLKEGKRLATDQLVLDGLNWKGVDGNALSRFFARLGGVRVLEIANSQMDDLDAVIRGLAALNKTGLSEFQSINFKGHRFTRQQVISRVPSLLKFCPNLRQLNLESRSLGDRQTLRSELEPKVPANIIVDL